MDIEEIEKLSVPSRKPIINLFDDLDAKVFVGEEEYCDYKLKESESKILISESSPSKNSFLQCFKNSSIILFLNEEFLFFESESESDFIGKTLFFSGNNELFLKLFKEFGLICYPEKFIVEKEFDFENFKKNISEKISFITKGIICNFSQLSSFDKVGELASLLSMVEVVGKNPVSVMKNEKEATEYFTRERINDFILLANILTDKVDDLFDYIKNKTSVLEESENFILTKEEILDSKKSNSVISPDQSKEEW